MPADWLDGNNHWSTAVTVRGDNPANRETELLPYLASTMPDVDSAYMELHIEEGTVIGVSFIKDGSAATSNMPGVADFRSGVFGYGGSQKAGICDGEILGTIANSFSRMR